jgi:hypothetical protein
MACTATLIGIGPQPVDATQNCLVAKIQFKFSGTYSFDSKHGDVVSLVNAYLPSGQVPVQADFFEAPPAGTAPTGYGFYYCPGTTVANGRICVFQGAGSAAPSSEISQNSGYPSALTGTTYIYAYITFPGY